MSEMAAVKSNVNPCVKTEYTCIAGISLTVAVTVTGELGDIIPDISLGQVRTRTGLVIASENLDFA